MYNITVSGNNKENIDIGVSVTELDPFLSYREQL